MVVASLLLFTLTNWAVISHLFLSLWARLLHLVEFTLAERRFLEEGRA